MKMERAFDLYGCYSTIANLSQCYTMEATQIKGMASHQELEHSNQMVAIG